MELAAKGLEGISGNAEDCPEFYNEKGELITLIGSIIYNMEPISFTLRQCQCMVYFIKYFSV